VETREQVARRLSLSPEDVRAIVGEPLVQLGDHKLNAGKRSCYKLVCDQFIADNVEALAWMLRQLAGPYGSVAGIPRGGLSLAAAMEKYRDRSLERTLLLVDDVITTGGSLNRERERLAGQYDHIIGVAVFSRGPLPSWVSAMFEMPKSFWSL